MIRTCSGCSFTADTFDGAVVHLENRGVSFVAVWRGPLERLLGYRERMGWSFPLGTPNGRGDDLSDWLRRHDEYEEALHAG